jgi:protein tyrosine/serine phosphatase
VRILSRDLDWDGCLNARDLGGLPTRDGGRTREGILFRSDTTCALTERGRRQVLGTGVRSVIDLRGDWELTTDPNPFATMEGITYLHRPMNDKRVDEQIARIDSPPERYVAMIDADGQRLAAIFDALATAPRTVLFHCLGGRDRTGIVSAMALSLAGVPDEHIEDDFALSDERLAPRAETWKSGWDASQLERFERNLREARDSIAAALRRLRERNGIDAYLVAHGLAPARIDALRRDLVAV